MHHADTVQKAGMGRARKHQAQDVVLTNVPEPLEQRMVNHLNFMAIQWNATVHGVHNELVVSTEQIVNGTSHSYKSPKLITLALLYHSAVPE